MSRATQTFSAAIACALTFAAFAEQIDTAKHWDTADAETVSTAARERVCLNGFWQFRAVKDENDATALADGPWDFLKVPGGFRRCYHLHDAKGARVNEDRQEAMFKSPFGLYRRTFMLDKKHEGRSIFLDFDAVMDRGVLFVNGQRAATLNTVYNIFLGKVDITEHVKFGAANDVRVVAAADPKKQPWARQAGVTGDVWLSIEPKGVRVESWNLTTSVADKKVKIAAQLSAPGANHTLGLSVFSEDGRQELFSLSEQPLQPEVVFDLAAHWAKIQAWNIENPRLYRVVVRVKNGAKLVDEVADRVGFCETKVQGKDIHWNGRPFHRRGCYRLAEGVTGLSDGRQDGYLDRRCLGEFLRMYKALGYNALTVPCAFGPQLENLLDACDEEGVVVYVNLLTDYSKSLKDNKPPLDELLANQPRLMKRVMRHPCIGAWGTWFTGGFAGDEVTRNPNGWSGQYLPKIPNIEKYMDLYKRSRESIVSADASRPVLFHSGTTVADCITAYLYPCLGTPPQEVESWPRKWHAEPVAESKPMWLLESTAYYASCWYNMKQARDDAKSDNHVFENAARYFGPKAFAMGPADDPSPNILPGHVPTKGDTIVGNVIQHDKLPEAFLESQLLLSGRVYRSWRAFGLATIYNGDELFNCFQTFRSKGTEIGVHQKYFLPHAQLKQSGPVCDWYYWNERFVNLVEPKLPLLAPVSPIHDRFRDGAWAPFIAFLAHKGETFADFTHKDHSYLAGETIAKQVVLINDHMERRKVRYSVTAGIKGGAEAKAASGEFEMESGEIRFVPFELKAPDGADKREFVLKLTASIDAGEFEKSIDNRAAKVLKTYPKERRDELELVIWPAPAAFAAKALKVALYDEVGRTKKDLERLGLAPVNFETDDLSGANLVVVGRESLTAKFSARAAAVKLQEKLESGAVDLLVMEQTPRSAPALAADLDALSVRDAFALDAAHPALAGLRDADLKSWRGESDIIPPMQKFYFHHMPGTQRFMKWTNENIVCSHVLRKPEYGNARPLIEAEFDLRGAGLLECFAGKGAVVFCQMDVTGRADPAAQTLLKNVLGYLNSRASAPKPDPFRPAFLLGNGAGTEMFKRRGVQAQPFTDTAAAGTLLIAGATAQDVSAKAAAIRAFVEKGGEVLYLVDKPGNFAASLVPGVNAQKSDAFRFMLAGGSDALRGVSQAELVFDAALEAPVFSGECKALVEPGCIAEVRIGKGRILLAPLLDPDKFARSFTLPRIERLYSVLLTNLGVRQAPLNVTFPVDAPKSSPDDGVVHWDFEKDEGGWSGGKVSTQKPFTGKQSIDVVCDNRNGWDRGRIELKKDGGVVTVTEDSCIRLAGYSEINCFVIVTIMLGKHEIEAEIYWAGGEWTVSETRLADFSDAKDIKGKTITSIQLRWGGTAEVDRKRAFYFDDISIGPPKTSVFARHPKQPTYDANMYVTW